jgi:signal transduction histidine kinase
MALTPFDELKAYVDFDEQDATHLRALARWAHPVIPAVVSRFYEVLLKHPGARSVFVDGQAQVERLKKSLQAWLEELFDGCYGDPYFQARHRIGATHVRIGLPQKYMPLAIEVVWAELSRRLREIADPKIEDQLRSLHKLLILDLTIMLGSYQDSYAANIREAERRAIEGQLERAQHLAEIGQLAASLAHEVKNPLAGISGAIQIIGDSLPDDSSYKSIVHAILGQISRLDATVKDLLFYARPAPPFRKNVKIAELVNRTLGLLQEEPSLRGVNVRLRGPDATICVDEGQLEQLMMNLLLNAAHASAEGSTIDVEVRGEEDRWVIAVRDHGVGMPQAVLDRAMEPFFTTKAKGTGLGLAICRRIVESHGGSMSIHSKPGKGTIVTVDLPRPEDPIAEGA